MNLRKRGAGQLYGGQWHPRGCACPQCDPAQDKLRAQRARAAADRAAAKVAPPPAPQVPIRPRAPSPAVYAAPRSDDTRRLAELLRAGHTFASAAEIIEAERQQRKDPP